MVEMNNPLIQTDLDRHFAQFSGHELSTQLPFSIKPDADTLIHLGNQLHTLHEQNKDLEQQNKALLAELAKLKSSVGAANRQTFFKEENAGTAEPCLTGFKKNHI